MSSAETIRGSSPDTVKLIEPVRPNIFALEQIVINAPDKNKDFLSSLKQISLWDSLSNAADEISKITSTDPRHRKAVEVILTNGKDIIENKPILYAEGQFPKSVKVTSEQWVLGLVRSNNRASTTPDDIISILGDPKRRDMSTSFVLVVNHKENELFMRTQETPSLSKDQVTEARKKWGREKQGFRLTNLLWGKKGVDKFVKEYNLLKFSGPANSPIVSRVIV